MNHQRFGVADIGQMREQFDRVDELLARFQAALDAKADEAAETALEVLRGDFVARIVGQAGIGDPVDQRMGFEPAGDFQRVGRMLFLPQRQAFPVPAKTRNALNGLNAAPMSRNNVTRTLRMKATLPMPGTLLNASQYTKP